MLKLYNSLSKKKEDFKPQKGREVKMYNCGPTVYDFAHIGNLRSFLFADTLRRYMEYSGYKVKQVMNITDVGHMLEDADTGEDKIERAALRAGKTPKQISAFYTKAFFEDIKKLGIEKAYKYPRATDHVKEMIEVIKKLIKNGYAYEKNGPSSASTVVKTLADKKASAGKSIYYDLKKFKNYGKLSGNKMEDLIAGARVEVNSEKKNPYDFALWIHNPNHKMQWNSPWGKGYPGWHIECSAMSMKYLGKTLDIHTGGEDNKFPHHECEIAQSEGANKVKFSNFWLHTKHLLVDGQKMSKSKGNFYTLEDLLKKGYSARAVRYLLISAHYRDELNFTFSGLDAAESVIKKLDEFFGKLSEKSKGKEKVSAAISKAKKELSEAMNDDLNVAKAFAVMFEFIKEINQAIQKGIAEADRKSALKLLKDFDKVFGFNLQKPKQEKIPAEVLKMAKERDVARVSKDWARADKLRAEISAKGYAVEDTVSGAKVKRIN
jgi:cysteinyl-tRNA synthetase